MIIEDIFQFSIVSPHFFNCKYDNIFKIKISLFVEQSSIFELILSIFFKLRSNKLFFFFFLNLPELNINSFISIFILIKSLY